jgi:hypothetical protein
MAISMVKVRAKITIGNLVVQTPYVLGFSVTQTRGQYSVFDASIKVSHVDLTGNVITGDHIKIEAGEDTPNNVIFSGIVKSAKITPVFEDPSFALINISGSDVLSTLDGKKFVRRCRATQSTWISINGVVRQGLRSSKFKAKKSDLITLINTDMRTEDSSVGVSSIVDNIKNSPRTYTSQNNKQVSSQKAIPKES